MQRIPPYGRKWRGTKKPLEKGERIEWENWLKSQHSKNKDHGIWSHHFMANRWGNNGKSDRLYFLGLQKHCLWWLQPWKAMTNLGSILKNWDITLPTKIHLENYDFPVVMYGCESGTIKKAECQRIDAFELVVLEKTLEGPLDCKEIQPVNSKGNQHWIFILRTDAEAEAPILWPPDGKSQLVSKGPDAGKDWRQEEKRVTEDEMVGWHHSLNGHEFGQVPQDGKDREAWCPWGCKELDTTEWLKNNKAHFPASPPKSVISY